MILDATCGGRQMWFDKNRDDVVFMDLRTMGPRTVPMQPGFTIQPDVQADFTEMPFADEWFDLVVFDPPHASVMADSIIGLKYGTLFGDWKPVLAAGLLECWRVLKAPGTLIFKWAEAHVPVLDVLRLVPTMEPAFGHTTAKSGSTIWTTFHKGAP